MEDLPAMRSVGKAVYEHLLQKAVDRERMAVMNDQKREIEQEYRIPEIEWRRMVSAALDESMASGKGRTLSDCAVESLYGKVNNYLNWLLKEETERLQGGNNG